MLKKICSIFTTILIIILACLAGILLVPRAIGYQSLAVLSGSMEPLIPVGSIVFVKEAEPENLEVGDIVTYRLSGDTMVTHRVEEIDAENQQIITKGDANDSVDANPVSYNNIVGKVNFHLPYLGYMTIYIKTPLGIAVACGVVIVLILLLFLPDIFSKEENEKEKN